MRTETWIALAAAAAATSAAAAPAAESRYTTLRNADCAMVESGEPQGEDWVMHRCRGVAGLPVWVVYTDSVRMQLAFGPKAFAGYAVYSAERNDAWKLDWRGTGKGAAFRPYAVIARMTPPEGGASVLAVYRVWADKPSCRIGQAADNAEARRIADAAATLAACPE